MTQIIETVVPTEQKSYDYNYWSYELNTGDYDYAHKITVDFSEKIEKVDYNDPERECLTKELWLCNGEPTLLATHNRQLEGPTMPDRVEIINPQNVYKLLISLSIETKLWNN